MTGDTTTLVAAGRRSPGTQRCHIGSALCSRRRLRLRCGDAQSEHREDRRVVGAPIVVTIEDFHPVGGRVLRAHEQTVGICFEPQRLKTGEVRRLITRKAA